MKAWEAARHDYLRRVGSRGAGAGGARRPEVAAPWGGVCAAHDPRTLAPSDAYRYPATMLASVCLFGG
jgi:hypothetical protein